VTRKTPVKDVTASVHDRLLRLAKDSGRPFGEVLQYFAMERFLYRLSVSSQRDRFVLKGALMLRTWDAPLARPTMDIDLQASVQRGRGEASPVAGVPAQGPAGIRLPPRGERGYRATRDAGQHGGRTGAALLGHLDSGPRVDLLNEAAADRVAAYVARMRGQVLLRLREAHPCGEFESSPGDDMVCPAILTVRGRLGFWLAGEYERWHCFNIVGSRSHPRGCRVGRREARARAS